MLPPSAGNWMPLACAQALKAAWRWPSTAAGAVRCCCLNKDKTGSDSACDTTASLAASAAAMKLSRVKLLFCCQAPPLVALLRLP